MHTSSNQSIGSYGEQQATDYLIKSGFQILHRNYRTKYGELDIVAKKLSKIHFIEVKTRMGLSAGQPYESVTPTKVRHLRFAMTAYIQQFHLQNYMLSFDVISLVLTPEGSVSELKFFEAVDF
ncbi:YraN family protein [Candidatus Roizmanbacteria bacterium]|nr:YraN family protein [Candidatus Roizmanbacteria bacterium]